MADKDGSRAIATIEYLLTDPKARSDRKPLEHTWNAHLSAASRVHNNTACRAATPSSCSRKNTTCSTQIAHVSDYGPHSGCGSPAEAQAPRAQTTATACPTAMHVYAGPATSSSPDVLSANTESYREALAGQADAAAMIYGEASSCSPSKDDAMPQESSSAGTGIATASARQQCPAAERALSLLQHVQHSCRMPARAVSSLSSISPSTEATCSAGNHVSQHSTTAGTPVFIDFQPPAAVDPSGDTLDALLNMSQSACSSHAAPGMPPPLASPYSVGSPSAGASAHNGQAKPEQPQSMQSIHVRWDQETAAEQRAQVQHCNRPLSASGSAAALAAVGGTPGGRCVTATRAKSCSSSTLALQPDDAGCVMQAYLQVANTDESVEAFIRRRLQQSSMDSNNGLAAISSKASGNHMHVCSRYVSVIAAEHKHQLQQQQQHNIPLACED